MKTKRRKCAGCGKRDVEGEAPMLHDHLWLQLADRNEILCCACFFDRAAERQVALSLEALRPCPFNLFHWPRSWFNLFAEHNTPPTIVDAEWSEAAKLTWPEPAVRQWLEEHAKQLRAGLTPHSNDFVKQSPAKQLDLFGNAA
jgi:hypothetical protein